VPVKGWASVALVPPEEQTPTFRRDAPLFEQPSPAAYCKPLFDVLAGCWTNFRIGPGVSLGKTPTKTSWHKLARPMVKRHCDVCWESVTA
jgi:hypothetical protein